MSVANTMVHCQLWMGGLEPYMTESFILSSFQRMGEKPMNVKVMRNKYSGEPAGYCFVHFENDDEAIDAMHKLNGKVIPNTNPPVRFRLNTASNQGKILMNEREFSLWVGDLTQEVDDYTLFKCFAAKYQSIKAAKVILDAAGYSKGFGFLRFGLEEEQKHCLAHMNGYKGLGSKPLKISNAIPKSQRNPNSNGPPMGQQSGGYQYPTDYSHYYDPNYWQNYSQWSGYGYDPNSGYSYDPSSYAAQYSGQYPGQYSQYPPPSGGYPQQNYSYPHPPYPGYYPPQTAPTGGAPPATAVPATPQSAAPTAAPVDDASEVVEHSPPVDVGKENREYSDAILNFWMDLASSVLSNQEVFEEEMDKLNQVEVTTPTVNIKFENKEAAKRAVEAQYSPGLQDFSPLESGSSGDERGASQEPDVKKRKLSTDIEVKVEVKEEDKESSTTEEGKEALSVKPEVKEEPMDGVNVEEFEAVVKEEREDVVDENPAEEKVEETPEEIERKERLREQWKKVEGFMAAVDVDTMMNETESVSSDSTDNDSDADTDKEDGSKSNGKSLKDKEDSECKKEGESKLDPGDGETEKDEEESGCKKDEEESGGKKDESGFTKDEKDSGGTKYEEESGVMKHEEESMDVEGKTSAVVQSQVNDAAEEDVDKVVTEAMECEEADDNRTNGVPLESESPDNSPVAVETITIAEVDAVSEHSDAESIKVDTIVQNEDSLDDRPLSSRFTDDQQDATDQQGVIADQDVIAEQDIIVEKADDVPDESEPLVVEPTAIVISEDESRTSGQSDELLQAKEQTNDSDVVVVNGDSQDRDQSSDQDSDASEDSNSDSD